MHWSRGWSYTDHVPGHAQIPWLIMNWSRGYHALITWLIIHWSRAWSSTDHVTNHELITWQSCTDHVNIMNWLRACHAQITWLIMNWSRRFHALITWISRTDHVVDHTPITWLIMYWSRVYHALIRWLIIHCLCNWSCTDHVAIMPVYVAGHAMIT